MAYVRVIPRDLFNESKLLKCLGQLALAVHEGMDGGELAIDEDKLTRGFEIDQDRADGSLWCINFDARLRSGCRLHLSSGYNCKSPYPLTFAVEEMGQYGDVFNDDGSFSPEFKALLASQTVVELARGCAVGTLVKARRLDGVTLEGVLVEWDNGTAIVNVEGRAVAIRCD